MTQTQKLIIDVLLGAMTIAAVALAAYVFFS